MAKNTNKTSNETNATETATILSWGTHAKVNINSLPPSTIYALAQRGFTHILGNEVASYASSLAKKTNDAGEPLHTKEEIETLADAKRVEKLNQMAEGKLGVGSNGPRVKGIDAIIRDVALEAIRKAATAKKVPMPKGEALQTVITAAIAKNGDAYRVEAERRQSTVADLDDLI